MTAGPTREHLDDVRFFSNGSSGRMGYAIAAALVAEGLHVDLVSGPVEIPAPAGVALHRVVSALEMQAAADRVFDACDLVIAVAAVADYRPRTRLAGKPPKGTTGLHVDLVPNPDIVAGLAARKGTRTIVGFALESASVEDAAGSESAAARALARGRDKLVRKGLDLVVVNLATTIGDPEIAAWLVAADGRTEALPRAPKERVAAAIVARALALVAQRRGSVRS